jgi:hypothetical protein
MKGRYYGNKRNSDVVKSLHSGTVHSNRSVYRMGIVRGFKSDTSYQSEWSLPTDLSDIPKAVYQRGKSH